MMWERSAKLEQWLDQIQIESAVISAKFQKYTTWVIDTAKSMHEQHQTVPGVPMNVPVMGEVELALDPKLSLLLTRAVPEQVMNEARAIFKGNGTTIHFRRGPPFRSLSILLANFEFTSPGGMEQ